jgi:hypothetical protein
MKRILRSRENDYLRCLTEKMLTYALGRELTVADRPEVQQIVAHVKAHGYRLDELIEAVVLSPAFQRS